MSRDRLLVLLGAIALAVGGTCQAPGLRIPTPRGVHDLTRMPLTIEVEHHANATPGTLLVTLNGSDITSLLTLDPPSGGWVRAHADFVWGAAFVLTGANTLVASIDLEGSARSLSRSFQIAGDPYVDAVDSTTIGANGGFNQGALPGVVLGPPAGGGLFGGSLDVFSLGISGDIVVEFTDNVIADGPGVDFTVFENPFLTEDAFQQIESVFSEAGQVSVSQDGAAWFAFSCANTSGDHPFYPGCAGVYPVLANGETDSRHPSVPTTTPTIQSFIGQFKPNVVVPEGAGGDSFDLADVGLAWARYVRIEAADHVVGPAGAPSAGFDLDAIAAVHSVSADDVDANGVPDAIELR